MSDFFSGWYMKCQSGAQTLVVDTPELKAQGELMFPQGRTHAF